MDERERKLGLILCSLVLLLSACLCLFKLNKLAFLDYDEANYADVMRSTNMSGQILTPQHSLIGNDFEKPPLYFWLGMALHKTGMSPEWAYRLPAALAGILSVILVMLITFALTQNLFTAALAGLILTTTGLYIEASRQVRLDVPMVASSLFAFYAYLRAREVGKEKWLLGIGLGIGLAVMFKSVVGLLVVPIILIFAIINREFPVIRSWLINKYFWLSGMLALLIFLPWHIYEYAKFGNTFWNAYKGTVLGRYSKAVLSGGVSEKHFFYLPGLFKYSFPWLAVFVISLIKFREKINQSLASIIIFIYAFFEISRTKLLHYFLPLLPFVAIICAIFISRFVSQQKSKSARYLLGALSGILIITAAYNTTQVAFHKTHAFQIDQLVANEEKELGLKLLALPKEREVYTYKYAYLDTIRYYSGGRIMKELQDDQVLDKPFYLIISKPLYDSISLPSEIASRLEPVYTGESVILLSFNL